MARIVMLFILGILAVTVELFVPGFGVFGIGGVTAIAASLIFCYLSFGMNALIAEIIIVLVILGLIFFYIKKYKLHGKIVLEDSVDGDKTNKEDFYRDFINKKGVAKTPLRPCGNAKFGSETIEVFSDEGFIESGKEVTAIRVFDNKLYVVEHKED